MLHRDSDNGDPAGLPAGVEHNPDGDLSCPDPYVPAVPVYSNHEGRRSREEKQKRAKRPAT